ncbi:DUF3500 domain-containing protein [Luteolibacter algae]|uniref:DUF3500 domain-containing protein n=1 Tax=Luteolibacter algae TaxID=454151 RepID=A0ABW5D486_9BACT
MNKILLFTLFAASPIMAKESSQADAAALQQVSSEMTSAAKAFLASLDEAQAAKARFPFDSDERMNWAYVPKARKGIPLEELNEKQISLVRELLKSALSDPGMNKADAIMSLEAFLAEIEKRPELRNPKAYFTSIFGEPEDSGTWGWRYEGHHLSLNYTLAGGKAIAVTPSFFAANPGEIKIDHEMKGTRPLAAEEDLARALAGTLAENGKPVLFSEKAPREILSAGDRKITQLQPVGIKASDMTAAQQDALMELIAEFANRHRKELAEQDLKRIKANLANLRFGWAGGLKRDEPYYYRIQGKDFLVEVANVQNNGNHIHTTWRDRSNDFGRDLLGDHVDHEH